jgi:hypothetical protein
MDGSGKGLALIEVSSQPRSKQPFIVTRVVDNEGKLLGAIVGYYRRIGTASHPTPAEEIQGLLRDGLLFRDLLDARDLDLLGRADTRAAQEGDIEEATVGKLESLIRAVDVEATPLFWLAAVPLQAADMSAMFESEHNRLSTLLTDPPKLRELGFNLDMPGKPEIVEGQLRRSSVPGYGGLELWRDGSLLWLAPATEEFLCWAAQDYEDYKLINPVALIEPVLLFCKFAYALLENHESLQFFAGFDSLDKSNKPLALYPGPTAHPRQRPVSAARTAPASEAIVTRPRVDPTQEIYARAAYRIVSEVYSWFGLTHDRIPYVDKSSGEPVIDEEAIKNIGSMPIYR